MNLYTCSDLAAAVSAQHLGAAAQGAVLTLALFSAAGLCKRIGDKLGEEREDGGQFGFYVIGVLLGACGLFGAFAVAGDVSKGYAPLVALPAYCFEHAQEYESVQHPPDVVAAPSQSNTTNTCESTP